MKEKEHKLQTNPAKGVYAGDRSIRDFLDSKNHPPTPLVALPESVNPFKKDGVTIMAKLLTFLPGGQVKSGPVYEMLSDAEKQDALHGVHTLFEASSGNTGGAAAMMLPHFGELTNPDVVVAVAPGISEGKANLLRLMGATVAVSEDGIKVAKEKGQGEGAINLGQYENAANPNFFYKILGPQLWEQTDGNIALFCAGLGSTGTMAGTGKYLKEQNPNVQTIGVAVPEGDFVPGVRTMKRLKQVSHDWQSVVDHLQFASTRDSYATSLTLIRQTALFAGPSSGFALQGLLQELAVMKENGALDRMKKKSGEIVAVFPVPDGPLAYVDEYFKYLDPTLFHPVQKNV